MELPHSIDADAEASEQILSQVVDGLRELPNEVETRGRGVLARNGFADPQPDSWVPLEEWLAALYELLSAIGDDSMTYVGAKIPEGVSWPSAVDSPSDGFATVDEAYQMNHRGGDVGYYEFVEVADRERRVVCRNPYPCPFDKGVIEGTLRTFSDDFSYTPLIFVHETSDRCRIDGGSQYTYRVTW